MDETLAPSREATGDAGRGRQRGRLRDFSQSLPMSLLKAREAVMRHFRESLRDHGITEQQWRVLRALSSLGEMEIAALAHATCLLGPSLSRILRDLERRRLVFRRLSDTDLRRALVSISPEGAVLIERVSPHSEAIYNEIARRFGAERLAQLQQLLSKLETAMSTTGATASGTARDG